MLSDHAPVQAAPLVLGTAVMPAVPDAKPK
jgi:hypothetical protein